MLGTTQRFLALMRRSIYRADQQKSERSLGRGAQPRASARLLKRGNLLLWTSRRTTSTNTRARGRRLERFGAACRHHPTAGFWTARDHLAFEERQVWFEGNYREYEADRRKRLGKSAERPTASVQELISESLESTIDVNEVLAVLAGDREDRKGREGCGGRYVQSVHRVAHLTPIPRGRNSAACSEIYAKCPAVPSLVHGFLASQS